MSKGKLTWGMHFNIHEVSTGRVEVGWMVMKVCCVASLKRKK